MNNCKGKMIQCQNNQQDCYVVHHTALHNHRQKQVKVSIIMRCLLSFWEFSIDLCYKKLTGVQDWGKKQLKIVQDCTGERHTPVPWLKLKVTKMTNAIEYQRLFFGWCNCWSKLIYFPGCYFSKYIRLTSLLM